ncbi:MAG TPA: ATP-binding protein, partial [Bryobacteraceae bacterium]|nr:ATP-binding protein [Bryobacteraceae bacterium]
WPLGHSYQTFMADHQSGPSGSVEMLLESTLESVDTAETVVLKAAEEAGFEEEHLHKLGMAVREAAVNAVVHGNRYNLRKKVHLSVRTERDSLRIVISDEGEGFEMNELPDPLAEENLLRQSGRGLLLIQAFVDEFRMERGQPPLGTEVTLVVHKNRQQS